MFKEKIDYSDIPAITDFSEPLPNPFLDDFKKHGVSIRVHYSPKDIEKMIKGNRRLDEFDLFGHDEEELAAFEEYRKSQAKLAQ